MPRQSLAMVFAVTLLLGKLEPSFRDLKQFRSFCFELAFSAEAKA
jgi:ABC-type polysaccharide/polyol phosphate export permease